MRYQRNSTKSKPTPPVDPKVVDRRRDATLKAYHQKVKDLNEEIRLLDKKKSSLEATLQASYNDHQAKINILYADLEKAKKDFALKCHNREAEFVEKQQQIDAQQADFETQRISIADSKMDLVNKENQLIAFGNELNAQQQINENDKEYVHAVEQSNEAARFELDALQQEANAAIKRSQERQSEIIKMENDLNARIKEHDTRLNQIKEESAKLQKVITEYKEAQAATLISQAERREFDQAVQENREYAARLKKLDIALQDKEQKLKVEYKAAHALKKDYDKRMTNIKILEKTHLKEA